MSTPATPSPPPPPPPPDPVSSPSSAPPFSSSSSRLQDVVSRSDAGSTNGGSVTSHRSNTVNNNNNNISNSNNSNNSSNNTMHLVRRILGQRKNDYRSDGPTASAMASAAAASAAAAGSTATNHNHTLLSRSQSQRTNQTASYHLTPEDAPPQQQQQQQRFSIRQERKSWKEYLHYCCSSEQAVERRNMLLEAILVSKLYKALLLLFTFVLLFGAEIRDLFIPPAGDAAMDGLFILVFVVFWLDICMRMLVEPNYFAWQWGGGGGDDDVGETTSEGCCWCCQIGSFLFWCEVASTLAVLVEISEINRTKFEERMYQIQLDTFGIPIDGLRDLNQALPIEYDVTMIATIAKTARVVRFIRSSAAVKISSQINWYWCLNIFQPAWWCPSNNNNKSKNTTNGGSHHVDASAEAAVGDNNNNTTTTTTAGHGLVRRNSWGSLGLGALSAVKAQQQSILMQEADRRKGDPWNNMYKQTLRLVGLGGYEKDAWRRHLAATKIQRVWRKCTARRQGEGYNQGIPASESSHMDAAWQSSYRTGMNHSAEMAIKPRSGPSRALAQHYALQQQSRMIHSSIKRKNESQVGSKMRELTGQRVAIGIIFALLLTVLFSYTETDATRPASMVVLHNQTGFAAFSSRSLQAARQSAIPDLFFYEFANGTNVSFDLPEAIVSLRDRETLRIIVDGPYGQTMGLFAYRDEVREEAIVLLVATIFILLVWFFGVTAFAGPVMILVVIPIERMVRLLRMLMLDPLGYQSTPQYKRFVAEEDEITKNTRWTKEVLKGMETSFLMSTILRIGSLMKVGFGSAGVEIIRNNLEKGQSKNMLILSERGSTVSCIFLFCDIRQFTDATECLQEEVFVFTNRIAAVVHSICHSYGGSANKNIGDAFLLSWLLDDEIASDDFGLSGDENFVAKNNQADKALLSVVKICMALHHDDYYIQTMSTGAREALLTKLSKRKGPVVQMGFGLHAGKAVQGAIGSQRKIDATYVSEAVERAEFLESSTKKYGVKMLMSGSFHRLLHPSNRRRCRKVDQILIRNDEDDSEDDYMSGDRMELLTFDMDIDALWKNKGAKSTRSNNGKSESGHESDSESAGDKPKREMLRIQSGIRQGGAGMLKVVRRRSARLVKDESSELSDGVQGTPGNSQGDLMEGDDGGPPELVLPTGPAMYNANVWVNEDMRRIRQLYSDGLFFQKFNSGLQSFYNKDWDEAKRCFVTILERFEDGPSRYFLTQIETHNSKPPRNFIGYGIP